jgi:alkanesulfonate monooxygenase SsuD/methylene tetrahydromethanopterin reductase-like flavin-dependent oxidoreductase (luciferase family)
VRPSIPIMLGGSGEQKTFRLAARFADHMNVICDREDIPRKLAALRQRCEEVDRDPATLPTSYLASVMMLESAAQVQAVLDRIPPERRSRVFVGTPDQVADELKRDVLDPGFDGLIINMILNGHEPGAVALAGRTLGPLLG